VLAPFRQSGGSYRICATFSVLLAGSKGKISLCSQRPEIYPAVFVFSVEGFVKNVLESVMTQILQIAAIAFATLGTGAATMTVMNKDIPDLAVPEGAWTAGVELDGRAFDIRGLDVASGAVLEDEILFRDGTFQSVDCQSYCDFGWSDYQTKVIDEVIHFTARTICPDAPHTVVWYGTVTGDTVEVDATWTTRRWYWTNQIVIAAEGSAVPMPMPGPAISG